MKGARLITSCANCGGQINDYASNRRKTKSGNFYCSPKCRAVGTAAAISRAHGGDGVKRTKREKDTRAYASDLDGRKSSRRRFYTENRERILAALKRRTRALKAEVIAAYGGRCSCCGETHHEFLTIDHTEGDGAQHRATMGKGRGIYRDLKRRGFPQDGYQLLCLNCNISLGFYGYCPHRPDARRQINKVSANPGRPARVQPLAEKNGMECT